jgi:hypothetical protein
MAECNICGAGIIAETSVAIHCLMVNPVSPMPCGHLRDPRGRSDGSNAEEKTSLCVCDLNDDVDIL